MSQRVYGRALVSGALVWSTVTTDSQGNNEYVILTWMIQVLKLVLGESPFYANYGIPAVQSVVTQLFPDFYVAQTQQQFQKYFASLIVSKVPSTTPTYTVNVLFFNGTTINEVVYG
jgi:hypothetical protein